MDGTPEFSRPVAVGDIAGKGRTLSLEADADEREGLRERFGLLAVESLTARVSISPLRGGRLITVRGRVTADVVQACVASLEPVPAHVAEDFRLVFDVAAEPSADAEVAVPVAGAEDADAGAEEEAEPLPPEGLDIGEMVAQELVLALDSYPRADGVVGDWHEAGEADEAAGADDGTNPFAALATLKARMGGGESA
mgnify:CR=1 FL=1